MTNRLISHKHRPENSFPGIEDADLLARVEKPARYVGKEVNEIAKDPAAVKLHMALAFPDVYEVGMSHLGLKILYSVVNARGDLYAERVFAPWPDMEALLRREGRPLRSLETGTPLNSFDLVGFSLQYELCATNVLQMLELGMIPLQARHRTRNHPFIVGGGPGSLNPTPLSRFFDAFVVGDGEEVILELAEAQVGWKETDRSRDDLLDEWKKIPGVYVPSRFSKGERISRRIVADLDQASFPNRPVVPFCETVHDRIGLEIARGCTRGCRFCQAGMVYRPVRERQPDTILGLAHSCVSATGWEEMALLSLSSGDYSCINELIRSITRDFADSKTALSLPSLRTDSFDAEMAEQIRKVRKTGFTLAPEAGTERLRRIINKGNTEEDLQRAVSTAFDRGWRAVKLYFMIGLPFETDEDLDGIVGLIRKASKWSKGGRITASVSTFVPKSHTPFQWSGQISVDETIRRQRYIRRYFQKGRTRVKFHDPRVSFLEGVIARGDERLGGVIECAYNKGARFDGWDEHLKFDLWMEAFNEMGIDPEEFLKNRGLEDALPWDFIDSGVAKDFLLREWSKAEAVETTADCRNSPCAGCGVCDFEEIFPRFASPEGPAPEKTSGEMPDNAHPSVRRFRLRYSKLGPMRFLGHHDVIRLFHRAFRRIGLRLDYSKGFHPHPRMRFSPPLGLGIESVAEYMDFDVLDCPSPAGDIAEALQGALPPGMQPLDLKEIQLNEDFVSGTITWVTYELEFPDSVERGDLNEKIRQFESSHAFEITKVHKGRSKTRNLKEWVCRLDLHDSIMRIEFTSGPSGSVHPYDAISAILGISRDLIKTMRLTKTSVGFESAGN
ncbi:MAG: TIGR03960 family B12-binding radical SAM protein [Pseudomonadota bacterium]